MAELLLKSDGEAYSKSNRAFVLDRVVGCALPLLVALLEGKAVQLQLELTGAPSLHITVPFVKHQCVLGAQRRTVCHALQCNEAVAAWSTSAERQSIHTCQAGSQIYGLERLP